VDEIEVAESGGDIDGSGAPVVVCMDGGECGGEANAGCLLDRMITLRFGQNAVCVCTEPQEANQCNACELHGAIVACQKSVNDIDLRRSSWKGVRRFWVVLCNKVTVSTCKKTVA
jgi:hypothetical protein